MQPENSNHALSINDLPIFSDTDKLYQWLFDRLYSYIKGRVFVIESGAGDLAPLLIANGIPIHINSQDDQCIEQSKTRFPNTPLIRKLHKVKLNIDRFEEVYCNYIGKFDTVLSLNLMCRYRHDNLSINNAKSLLHSRGTLILTTPVYTTMYDDSSRDLTDFQKYNQLYIQKLLGVDILIQKTRYFNLGKNVHVPLLSDTGLSAIVVCQKI